jgi:hypothetical protein
MQLRVPTAQACSTAHTQVGHEWVDVGHGILGDSLMLVHSRTAPVHGG